MHSLLVGIDRRPTEIANLLRRGPLARVRVALFADAPPPLFDTGSLTAARVGNRGPLYALTLAARRRPRRRDDRRRGDERDHAQLVLARVAR